MRRGALAKIVFSVKEAAYKAQFPLTRTFLEFGAMAVDLDADSQIWKATFLPGQRPVSCPWETLTGSWTARRGLIATVASVKLTSP